MSDDAARLAEIRARSAAAIGSGYSTTGEEERDILLRLLDAAEARVAEVEAQNSALADSNSKNAIGWAKTDAAYGRLAAALAASEAQRAAAQQEAEWLRGDMQFIAETLGEWDRAHDVPPSGAMVIGDFARARAALRPAEPADPRGTGWRQAARETAGTEPPPADPREPAPTRTGFWALHNCAGCDEGRRRCPFGTEHCELPYARNS